MKDKLPKCIGYVDGSLIRLDEAPTDDPESYYSRKQYYAIQLQAICDENFKIRNISVGYPGSVHDARVFANSEVGRDTNKFLTNGQYLVGDSAYAVNENMVTPFKRNSAVGTSQERTSFNTYISSYRVKIECVYGFLKETFGSLKSLRVRVNADNGHRIACEWITACCVLYNIIRNSYTKEEIEAFEVIPEDENENAQNVVRNQRQNEKTRSALLHFVLGKLSL